VKIEKNVKIYVVHKNTVKSFLQVFDTCVNKSRMYVSIYNIITMQILYQANN